VHEFSVLQHAQDLGWVSRLNGTDLVQEDGPAVGDFKQAFLDETALVNAPLRGRTALTPEVRGHRAGVDGTKGWPFRGEFTWMALAIVLAGSAFPLDQYGGAGWTRPGQPNQNPEHGLALATMCSKLCAV